MLRFYYKPKYKYTNRSIIDISSDNSFRDINYENIDSPDTINGHIIYTLGAGEKIPTYIVDQESGWRWFVSGITQLRTGKYQISLLRDIISENPELWKSEEAYINAGTAIDYNKYKKWDLPFTNTKTGEQRLNINGKSSFFVFYVNQQSFSNDNVITEEDLKIKSISVPGITSGFDYIVSNLNEIPSFEFVGTTDSRTSYMFFDTRFTYYLKFQDSNRVYGWDYDSTLPDDENFYIISEEDEGMFGAEMLVPCTFIDFKNNVNNIKYEYERLGKAFFENYQRENFTNITQTDVTNLQPYLGKMIYDENTNKIYKIKLTQRLNFRESEIFSTDNNGYTLWSALRNISYTGSGSLQYPAEFVIWYSNRRAFTYSIEEIGTATGFDFNFIAKQRKLPKSAVRCVNIVSSNVSDEEVAQALMLAQTNGINEDNTTGRILDIQFLPFSIATTTNENIKINNISQVAQFLDLDDYEYEINLPDIININKETDSIKIVSPSRASQFLFRPYDNNGNMMFNTKITLKPFSSVIYVRPSTQGLLMGDWDDKDCLIIQEDFSLTNVTSQWTEYVYNNRTYLNSFERQIQGREFERSWERKVEAAQARSDEWTARNISAQKAKTYTGNIPIISGIFGAAASSQPDIDYMKAAQVDREYNEALYKSGLSISRDLFSYQLENIKSQPLIPSRITTIDCKFLDGVYLEFYSTNQAELNAIQNYYKYNGNRIDAYGTFGQYYGWFVRGKIIKSNNYTQPEIDELNRRLAMGIYTEVQYAI